MEIEYLWQVPRPQKTGVVEEMPIIFDTNVWIEIEKVMRRIKEKTQKSYKEIWNSMSDDFLKNVLTYNELERFKINITTIKKIIEMKTDRSIRFVLHVPAQIYQEVWFGLSSKINSPYSPNDQKSIQSFDELLDSITFEKLVDRTEFKEGVHYPTKSKTNIKKELGHFMKENEKTLDPLVKYLGKAKNTKKDDVQEMVKVLHGMVELIEKKYKRWDEPMMESSKFHGFSYETRTKYLNSLVRSVKRYRSVNSLNFEPDPLNVIVERLTINGEEFDFFDLQTYLYAKEKDATLITLNVQAFQEIYDPSFLRYFENVKIMHPLINLDTTDDFYADVNFVMIAFRSLVRDMGETDVSICKQLDQQLITPVLEKIPIGMILKGSFNFKVTLGDVLKLLRIQNKQPKVNMDLFFEDYNQLKVLRFIDDKIFNGTLSSENFVKDYDPIKNSYLQQGALANYLERNHYVKEKLKLRPGKNLEDFLKIYKEKNSTEVRDLYLAASIERSFLPSEIEEAVYKQFPNPQSLPDDNCPPIEKYKRDDKCLLKWDNIEEFTSANTQEKNLLEIQIDSEQFLKYIKAVKDPLERMQLIQFVDQVLNYKGGSNNQELNVKRIIGPDALEVIHFINMHKVEKYFSKIYLVSKVLNKGFYGEKLLGNILEPKTDGVAMNIGFIAGGIGPLLAGISQSNRKYTLEESKVILGNSFKYASPFISRFMSPLVMMDLYNQIEAFKTGDKDHLVSIGREKMLTIDVEGIGTSLLEILGVIGEISTTSGPTGLSVGALVMIGPGAYIAVKDMQQVDRILKMTREEKLLMMIPFSPLKLDLQRLAELKEANNKLAQKAFEILEKSKEIQRVVIPSAKRIEENGIGIALNNEFYEIGDRYYIQWHRVRPNDPKGGWIFCAPEGDWENPQYRDIAQCSNAIGVAALTQREGNYTLFILGDGDDKLEGFKNSPNIFQIGKGSKEIVGGNQNDVFMIEEGISIDDVQLGYIDGGYGNDILDVSRIRTKDNEQVFIDSQFFLGKIASRDRNDIEKSYVNTFIKNIETIIGREKETDYIISICGIRYVDSRGGKANSPDTIHLIHASLEKCNYDTVIKLSGYTDLINEAVGGKIIYSLNDTHFLINGLFKLSTSQKYMNPMDYGIEHRFFINATTSDIVKMEFHKKYDGNCEHRHINLHFKNSNGTQNELNLNIHCNYDEKWIKALSFHLKNAIELRYTNMVLYGFVRSFDSVPGIIGRYRMLANDLGVPMMVHADVEDGIVLIGSNKKDNVLYNDPSHRTFLVGGHEVSNVYVVMSGQEVLQYEEHVLVPEVVIYLNPYRKDTLDLRPLYRQFKEDLGKELLLKHISDSEKLIIYLYTLDGQDNQYTYNNVTSITFKSINDTPTRFVWDSWCKRVNVILKNALVSLKCDDDYDRSFIEINNYDPSNYYTPVPVMFQRRHEIIVISEEDFEPHTQFIVSNNLGRYRFLRLEDDLILTNGFDFDVAAYRPTTIMMRNFYKDPQVFYTIRLQYDDKLINLNSVKKEIRRAKYLEDYYQEYYIKTSIIGNPPRRTKKSLDFSEYSSGINLSKESIQPESTSSLASMAHFVSDFSRKCLNYVQDNFKSLVSPSHRVVHDAVQKPQINFSDEHKSKNGGQLGWELKKTVSDDSSMTGLNSTLLLMDTLVRMLTDSKYKLPKEEYLLSPQESVGMKVEKLATELGFDLNDIVESIQRQQQRILDNMNPN